MAVLFYEMSAIKNGRYPLMLDKERHLLFSLNALDEIQDKFGGFDKIDELMKGKDSLKNIRWLLTLLINEGASEDEEALTEKQVGKLIHTGNFVDVKDAIFNAFSIGTSGDEQFESTDDEIEEDEDFEEDSKNEQSE